MYKEIEKIQEYLWNHYEGKLSKVGFKMKLDALIILANAEDWITAETPPGHNNDVIVWFDPKIKDVALHTEQGGKKKWLNTRGIQVFPKYWREFPNDPKE